MKILSDLFNFQKPDSVRREIFSVLARGQKSGYLDEESRKLIENILNFKTTLIREIMIPRTNIVSISSDDPPQDMLRQMADFRFTRIPVHRGSIDNIVGILNIKDLLKMWSENMTRSDILSHLARPYYIPETKSAHLLFHEFKKNKRHIAIVIDEYGGTSGLVTLEDLLEEIVGDIQDEHEMIDDVHEMIENAEGAVIIDGRTEIERVEMRLNTSLERGRYETISGFILNALKRIPNQGERININGLDITIENVDERSIKKIRIRKKPENAIHRK